MSGRGPRWFNGIKYPYEANFADNTWEQIIATCQRRSIPDTWAIGDQKTMTINGTDYLIDIIGKDHDDYSDGTGKAPLTFQMHDCYGTTYAMNSINTNSGGWTNCVMRQTRLPAILNLMPSKVKTAIRDVNKPTSAGGKSSTINITADKLFLLSVVEIFTSADISFTGEGTRYAYYKEGGDTVKKLGGSDKYWLTRSPVSSSADSFCAASSMGGVGSYSASAATGVAFAFCF